MTKSGITKKFEQLRKEGRKAFIPYIMAGDPDLDTTEKNVMMLEECGADIIELGVPFSDPLADGPTIQRAAERAMAAGVTMKKTIEFVKELRCKTKVPIILMTYYNPVFRYGEERFVEDAVNAGVDGVIIPDLPPEEAVGLVRLSRKAGLDTIFLVAPTSDEARIKKIVSASSGFVYYVSMTGITGSELTLHHTFSSHINKVKQLTDKPVAVGFGVSTPEDAKNISLIADGVIVGSAIVKKLYQEPENAKAFVKSLREAIS